MIEVIKHTLGFCGEHWHPNLWTILVGGFGLSTALRYTLQYAACRLKNLKDKYNEL